MVARGLRARRVILGAMLVLFALLHLPGLALAEPFISVQPHTTALELGEPLRVVVRAEGTAHDMYHMDVSALARNFRLEWVENARFRRERNGQAWLIQRGVLRLYPRRAGALTVPSLRLGALASEPVTVQVAPAHSLGLNIRSGSDNAQPYEREPVLVWLEIEADHGDFQTHVNALVVPDAYVEALGHERLPDRAGGYRERHQWLVTPLRVGPMDLELPWVEVRSYRRYGARLQLPTPPARLSARAAPSYLPVHVPLAPVTLTQRVSEGPLWQGEPYLWSLELRGRDLSTDGVRRLIRTALDGGGAADEAIRFFTPRVEPRDSLVRRTDETVLRVEVPFMPLQTGALALPGLRVPYFDTRAGRLAEAHAPALEIEVGDPLRHALRRAAEALVAVTLMALLVILSVYQWWAWRERARLRRRVQQAQDAPGLRAALLATAGAPPTLRAWLTQQRADARLADAVLQVEHACYGGGGRSTEALRARLAAALRAHRLRRPGWVRGR